MIAYCRPKILDINNNLSKIEIPLKRRTRNHLGSMYFGALSVGADFSGGLIVLNILRKHNSKAKLIFKDFKANFLKRATSDVLFVCRAPKEVEKAVLENLENKNRINFELNIEGFCHEELVASFTLTTSIK